MSAADWLAYVGAAAWAPPIISWIHGYYSKPVISVYPANAAEIGFTALGPIFNLGFVFNCENKKSLITEFNLTITHEDGAIRNFSWASINETLSEITDAFGGRQTVSRTQAPVALKVVTENLVDKIIRSTEVKFKDEMEPLNRMLLDKINQTNLTSPDDFIAQISSTAEYKKFMRTREQWFWWRAGRYGVDVSIGSPNKVAFKRCSFEFRLEALDVDILKSNINLLDLDSKNAILRHFAGVSQNDAPEPRWKWLNIPIKAIQQNFQ
ncbi:hypothetical protein [Thiomonas intermedia]|uniref:hypothetical protein n=1 Tax=Thiomonas intermedia TaxID=926 RepID=UPI0012ABBEB4|nr:hypothetical protein [Thiomonas intermedia]